MAASAGSSRAAPLVQERPEQAGGVQGVAARVGFEPFAQGGGHRVTVAAPAGQLLQLNAAQRTEPEPVQQPVLFEREGDVGGDAMIGQLVVAGGGDDGHGQDGPVAGGRG
ncbi:MAG: hypothetical protein ACRD2W_15830 [Acidimicrobiales bacterium]